MRMKVLILFAALGIFGSGVFAADVSFGLSGDQDGLKSFYLTVGEHFQAPEKEIVEVRKRRIADEEIPVVFFIASHAGVTCAAVMDQRERSGSWMDVVLHFGLSAEIFYVPVSKDVGPPYGKAYGHFKNRKREQWKEIHLNDGEIVNFVNLAMISDHYGYPPEDIIKMREGQKSFVDIHESVKQKKNVTSKSLASDDAGRGKGNAKADKKDRSKGKGKN